MTDKVTAERAFEWLLEHVRGNGRANKMPMNPQLRNQLAGIVRQALSEPRVPEGWKLFIDEEGNIRLDDVINDRHIALPPYHQERGDIWLKVVGGFLQAVLTAAPAPADSELARLRGRVKELEDALIGLYDAYCRSGDDLTRNERTEDRKRLIAARIAIAAYHKQQKTGHEM